MQGEILEEDGHLFQVVRDEMYQRELRGYIRADERLAVEIAYEMERDLLSHRGYPKGSYAIPNTLPAVDIREAEAVLCTFERHMEGDAQRALQWIDEQRVYEKEGMAIVYVIVRCNATTTIYLGALTQPSQANKDILWKFLWVDPGERI